MAAYSHDDSLRDIKSKLLESIPHSLKVLGNIAVRQKAGDVFPFQIRDVSRWADGELVVLVNPAEITAWYTHVGSVSLYAASDAALRHFLHATRTDSGLVDWSRSFSMSAVPHSYIGPIRELVQEKGGTLDVKVNCHIFYLPAESSRDKLVTLEQAQRTARTKPGVHRSKISLRPLNVDADLELVVGKWKFSTSKLRERTKVVVNHLNTVGVFLDTDGDEDKLVAWILDTPFASQGLLHTLPEHRGLGFAKLAISELTRIQLQEYGYAYAFVETDNVVSQELYKSLGFLQSSATYHWLVCTARCTPNTQEINTPS